MTTKETNVQDHDLYTALTEAFCIKEDGDWSTRVPRDMEDALSRRVHALTGTDGGIFSACNGWYSMFPEAREKVWREIVEPYLRQ